MPVSMELEFGGLFDPSKLSSYARFYGKNIHAAVGAGMRIGGKQALGNVRAVYARSVKSRKANFANVVSIKVFDKKKDELPALMIGTRAPLVAAHAHGADIPGPSLIPLLNDGERMGRKRFGLLIRGLVQSGNAEFRRVNGKTIVFAEAGAAKQSGLNIGNFRRAERTRRGGNFKKQKGKALEVPIAVVVRNVHVRAVFPFEASVQAGMPLITAAIVAELDKV